MLNKFLKTIEKYNMLSKGDSVTVALSGGADSVALLLALKKIEGDLDLSLSACHVNHNLRGEEAKRDENFCVELCKKLGVPIHVASVDVISKSKRDRLSTEMAARDLRYEALENFAKGKIATAHTLSDSLETSIFNFTRGTGLKGLCGITPVRGNIIRPLIDVTREEIEEFLKGEGQSFVNDSTNFENIYSRNKIRNIVIPVLKELNPSLFGTYEKNREMLGDEEDFLNSEAEKALKNAKNKDGSLNCEKLLSEHTAVRRRAIFKFFYDNDTSCDFKKVKLIDEKLKSGGDIEIKEGSFAHIRQGKLSLSKKASGEAEVLTFTIDRSRPQSFEFGNKIIIFTPIVGEERKFSVNLGKKAFKNYMDCDKLNFEVLIRTRRPGDKVELAGRNVTKTLKKLFNESRLLPDERDSLVILESGGEIAFIEGFGCAEHCKITDSTVNAVKISISNL